jgi:hypothetical protein
MYGHRVGDGVVSVAAVPWWDTPEFDTSFGTTGDIDPEGFTARGGELPIDFGDDGSFIGASTRPHPRLTAVDGNNTTFFGQPPGINAFGEPDDFPNFFGTSAAAPNAAAVVAGIQGYSAAELAPGKVERLIRDEAVDVQGERASTGTDDVTGAGLIDAGATLARFPKTRAKAPGQVNLGAKAVTLDGRDSSAPGKIAAYQWRQVAGPDVALRNRDSAQAHFDAPARASTVAFELVVTGTSGLDNAARVKVQVAEEIEFSGESGGGGSLGPVAILLALMATLKVGRSCRINGGADACAIGIGARVYSRA